MLGKNLHWCFKGLGIAFAKRLCSHSVPSGRSIAQVLTSQFVGAIILYANCAIAQITPDGTLPNISNVKSEGNTRIIEGGTRAGSNLFHSFSEFSVPINSTAVFNNAADIQNIISRVTGSSRSEIDGLIKVFQGNANLFLINPNGIIFKPNARLDVKGSFVASTANAIQFGNQGFFSATNPNNPALLTVNPSALFFNQIAAAPIQYNSVADADLNPSSKLTANGLGVPDGKSLLLVGGDINMNGGGLYAFGGQGNGGSVNIIARETVSFNRSNAISSVESTGVGKGGDINIDTSFLTLANNARLITTTSGQGDAGSVNINARERIDFDRGYIFSTLQEGASGKSGDITINTGSLALTNGGELVATTYGRGDAGNVNIYARNTVEFDGFNQVGRDRTPSGAFSNVESENAVGNGGNININTGSLYLRNGAVVNSRTRGQGNSGSVNIIARETVSFNRSNAISTVESTGVGNGGNIKITTELLEILNGAKLRATTTASNNAAGNIDVAANSIRLDQGTISADTRAGQGNINLRSRDLILFRGSNITTNAKGSNVIGGNINIDTDVLAAVENSFISANSTDFRGGQVIINAQGIFRSPGSTITATGATPQLSGTLQINTPDVDPSRGLVPLTVDVVDVARLVDDNICARTAKSSFTYTGRGGLPDSPNNTLNTDAVWEDWQLTTVPRETLGEGHRREGGENNSSRPTQIVEAQGWIFNHNGEVILIAYAQKATPELGSSSSACQPPIVK